MNKFKISIFILIVLVFVGITGYSAVINFIQKNNPLLLSEAKEVIIDDGEYEIGKDIEPGFYDLEVLKGDLLYNSIKISSGEMILSQELQKGSHVIIKNKGEIKFTPAKFDNVSTSKDKKYIITHSGNYIIGEQLPKGEYLISLSTVDEKEKSDVSFIQILPSFGEDALKGYEMKKNDTVRATLQEGNILSIRKSFYEEDENLKLVLDPI